MKELKFKEFAFSNELTKWLSELKNIVYNGCKYKQLLTKT